MNARNLQRHLADESGTMLFGEDIAAALKPGDVLALEGDLGAGKTSLARAVIRALTGNPSLEVPSPTFTLVQSYDARIPARHFDLYRLSDPGELLELGFDEAREEGVVLVEWPERAAGLIGDDVIRVRLDEEGEGRIADIAAPPEALARLERSLAVRDFVGKTDWVGGHRAFLLGDASTRAYETVTAKGKPGVILMNSPQRTDGPPVRDGKPYSRIAHLAENVKPFVAIGNALRRQGIAAPEVLAQDLREGLLLIENLGCEGVIDRDGRPIAERYVAAAELLARLHAVDWPHEYEIAPGSRYPIADYDRGAMTIEVELYVDWYLPEMAGASDASVRERFAQQWNTVFDRLEKAEKSLVLRDFHSPNLLWRGDRKGHDRLGVIDFQDALIGPSAYDVASLAMDARVTVEPALEKAILDAYCRARMAAGAFDRPTFDRAAFEEAYAIMAAQRNSKILGIFVRLNRRDGKPQYMKHLPRIRDYMARALSHEALAPVREFYHDMATAAGIAQ
ncbi:MAG: tRNA (adenosine(37)-N6)-threonylcarbamoyltransferase complex ATPase subunit type 1 TsaE [Hyphomicrobiales bacterium]|nr:tRNA (adenosine(37)-N6)-threonylcarbamoyltransferase complex ATPase subunit type 1 TsaE [Hyphomicrobiales bacterium]